MTIEREYHIWLAEMEFSAGVHIHSPLLMPQAVSIAEPPEDLAWLINHGLQERILDNGYYPEIQNHLLAGAPKHERVRFEVEPPRGSFRSFPQLNLNFDVFTLPLPSGPHAVCPRTGSVLRGSGCRTAGTFDRGDAPSRKRVQRSEILVISVTPQDRARDGVQRNSGAFQDTDHKRIKYFRLRKPEIPAKTELLRILPRISKSCTIDIPDIRKESEIPALQHTIQIFSLVDLPQSAELQH